MQVWESCGYLCLAPLIRVLTNVLVCFGGIAVSFLVRPLGYIYFVMFLRVAAKWATPEAGCIACGMLLLKVFMS